VDRLKPCDGFDLDDDFLFHEKINSVPAIECAATIYEWKRLLAVDLESTLVQLEYQTCFIRRFQHAGT